MRRGNLKGRGGGLGGIKQRRSNHKVNTSVIFYCLLYGINVLIIILYAQRNYFLEYQLLYNYAIILMHLCVTDQRSYTIPLLRIDVGECV